MSVVSRHVQVPCHMDLHPGRNIYLTSWFILSVLFLTGSKTSVVCGRQIVICLLSLHLSGINRHMDLHPGRNVYLTSWFILSVLFLTGGETSVIPTCV